MFVSLTWCHITHFLKIKGIIVAFDVDDTIIIL